MTDEKTTEEITNKGNHTTENEKETRVADSAKKDMVDSLLESLNAEMVSADINYELAEEVAILGLSDRGVEIVPDEDWTSVQIDFFMKLLGKVAYLRESVNTKKEIYLCAIHHPAHKTLEEVEDIPEEIQWPYEFEHDYARVVVNKKIELELSEIEGDPLSYGYACLLNDEFRRSDLLSESITPCSYYQSKPPYWLYLEIIEGGEKTGGEYTVRWGMDDTGLTAIACAEEVMKFGQVMHLCVEREYGCEEQWDVAIDAKPIDPKQMLPGFTYDPEEESPTEFVDGLYLREKARFMPSFTCTEIEEMSSEEQ